MTGSLLFSKEIPAEAILNTIQEFGITINTSMYILHPTSSFIYLGLCLDARQQQLAPTNSCICLLELVALVPRATFQDLWQIVGCITWLTWALAWPIFAVITILHHDTYWIRWLYKHHLLQQPRLLEPTKLDTVLRCQSNQSHRS